MGWLRLVGSLKLQVSFAKEPYKKDYILQKRPIILRSLLMVATPYAYARHMEEIQTSCRYILISIKSILVPQSVIFFAGRRKGI